MKVLVVVDMQKDFVDGSLGTKEAQAIVPLVAETIEQMADPNTVVIFTKDTHSENYMSTLEGKNLPVPHCIEGNSGWEINDEIWAAFEKVKDQFYPLKSICPFMDNHIICKPSFGSVDFQNVLFSLEDELAFINQKIEEVTLMGLCTGICVMSNAILAKATLPEVPVNVIEDCCACVTPESHKTSIEAMKLCQINII
jgi:nicotinamidase-related amidase